MLGPSMALLRREGSIWVDLGLEPGEEHGAGARGGLPCVVLRVHGVGGEPGAEGSLRRG
jgi:hypothetical protein